MKRIFIAGCLAIVLAGGAGAAEFSLKQALPAGWTPDGEISKVVGEKLYDLIDGFADIHMGFSYKDSEHAKLAKGKQQLEVSVFRCDTAANAFGLYSCLRDKQGTLKALPNEASISPGTAFVWNGPYVIEIKDTSEQPTPDEELLAVARALAEKMSAQKSEKPELVRALPKEKLIEKGLIYFHHRHPLDQIYYLGTDNPLDLGTDPAKPATIEAVYAEYEFTRGPQAILALRYAKSAEAAKALAGYTAMVKADMESVKTEGGWTVLTAKNGKQIIGIQSDRSVILALDSSEPEQARAIVEKIGKALEPKKEPAKK